MGCRKNSLRNMPYMTNTFQKSFSLKKINKCKSDLLVRTNYISKTMIQQDLVFVSDESKSNSINRTEFRLVEDDKIKQQNPFHLLKLPLSQLILESVSSKDIGRLKLLPNIISNQHLGGVFKSSYPVYFLSFMK